MAIRVADLLDVASHLRFVAEAGSLLFQLGQDSHVRHLKSIRDQPDGVFGRGGFPSPRVDRDRMMIPARRQEPTIGSDVCRDLETEKVAKEFLPFGEIGDVQVEVADVCAVSRVRRDGVGIRRAQKVVEVQRFVPVLFSYLCLLRFSTAHESADDVAAAICCLCGSAPAGGGLTMPAKCSR